MHRQAPKAPSFGILKQTPPGRNRPARLSPGRFHTAWTHKRHSAEPLFDHLVSSLQDRLRHGQAERLSGLEIDNQLEPGRLLNRQIGRLLTLEDLSDVSAGLANYQAAGS